jgi:hypothetical protein
MNESLKEKLINSESLRSLCDETTIALSLSDLGWNATVGPTYTDAITNKVREIDVRGRRHWATASKPKLNAKVTLLCESKRMDGFHLVFADSPAKVPSRLISMAHAVWLGDPSRENDAMLVDILVNVGMKSNNCDRFIDSLESISHPDGSSLVRKLMIPPFNGLPSATTFRETCIEKEKDMDNSVLWRACQALKSVITACKKSIRTDIEDNLELAARFGKLNKTFIRNFTEEYTRSVSIIQIFHPVVVVDAKLWMVRAGTLEQVPTCRFIQRSASDEEITWYDIVSRGEFDSYAKNMTKYYEHEFSSIGCDPEPDFDNIMNLCDLIE